MEVIVFVVERNPTNFLEGRHISQNELVLVGRARFEKSP